MYLDSMVRNLEVSGYYKKCVNYIHGVEFLVCATLDNKSYAEIFYEENELGEIVVTDVSFIYKECKL